MCELYDLSWKYVLGFLLFFSIAVLLLRYKYSAQNPPQWLAALTFWGQGLVAVLLLLLMVFGFVCVGSFGDIKGIVPN